MWSFFWHWINLLGLVIFRYEGALVYFYNQEHSLFDTFLILSIGIAISTLTIYWLTGRQFIKRRFYFPPDLIAWLRKKWIFRSFRSYRIKAKAKEKKRIEKLVQWILKLIQALGYTGLALGAMVPLPFFRTASVVACRISGLKNAIYVVLGAAIGKMLLETVVYYHFGKFIPFANRLSFPSLSLIIFGGMLIYTLIGWIRHAILDNHFIRGRFN